MTNRYWLDREGTQLPTKLTPGIGLPPECGILNCKNRVSTASGDGLQYNLRCDECLDKDRGTDNRRRWSEEDRASRQRGWPERREEVGEKGATGATGATEMTNTGPVEPTGEAGWVNVELGRLSFTLMTERKVIGGVVWEIVVEAPPVARWTVGRAVQSVTKYYKERRGARVTEGGMPKG